MRDSESMRTKVSRSSALGTRLLAGVCTVALAVTLVLLPPKRSPVGAEAPASPPNAEGADAATIVTVSGRQLRIDGKPFTVRGVGYAPTPIGGDPETASPNGDYFTSGYSALYNRDLPLLRQMGANTVRLWGWKYDADHSDFLDAATHNGNRPIYVIVSYWLDASRDISDPAARQAIKAEFTQMVAIHKNHPAVLMWAIGNELNAPWMFGDSDDLFSLIDEMAQAAHLEEGDNFHPVTTPLADVNLIDTIANRDAEVPNLDVWSVQVYRGSSFGNLFTDYAAASGKPLVITEYGIDAYDDKHGDEYEHIGLPYQAIYAESLWNEIAANSSVCSGGSIMAYSDEWWKGKHGQTDSGHPDCPEADPAFHSHCGYASGAHPDGYANEEWWGIMRTVDNGADLDMMQPRDVYYTLRSLWIGGMYLPLVLREFP
jgi:Glycosyl hydrolases family 2, TIM barrel domain